jgi:hypothetical protein
MKEIGVEIAEAKSGIVKDEKGWVKDRTKFLGLEYVASEDNLYSKTRNGAVKAFPKSGSLRDLKEIQKNYPDLPYLPIKDLDSIINTRGYEAGLKYGFLGCLISDAMTPGPAATKWEKQARIERGKLEKLREIEATNKSGGEEWQGKVSYETEQGFIWKFQDLHPVTFKTTLTNMSGLGCWTLTNPIYRELGMRVYSKTARKRKLERKKGSRLTYGHKHFCRK